MNRVANVTFVVSSMTCDFQRSPLFNNNKKENGLYKTCLDLHCFALSFFKKRRFFDRGLPKVFMWLIGAEWKVEANK